jgi:aminopeptidase
MFTDLASRLAKLLVHYSLRIKKGDTFFIEGTTEAAPLITEIYREAVRSGANPTTMVHIPGLKYILLNEGQEEQISYENPYFLYIIEHTDVFARIYSSANTRELANMPPEKTQKLAQSEAGTMRAFFMRNLDPNFRWCVLPWVTSANAIEANMSNEEYAHLIEKTCFLDQPDPAMACELLRIEQQKYCSFLEKVDKLHILAPGTDLTMSVKGRKWVNCHGLQDLPDGEVFSAPLEDSVNGVVSFTTPAREVEGVVLTFKNGEVVDFSARRGQNRLAKTLEIPGARRLGEVGIGTNFGQDRITNMVLFDEKMGGTIHLAIGSAYPDSGGKNDSGIHHDMLVDLRQEGRIYADDRQIFENGKFMI